MRYVFGEYILDTHRCELHHGGKPIKLRPKVFHVLAYLLAHCDRMVPKQELCASIWPHQYISNATFDSCMTEVRRAVGDSGRMQHVIQTRHGYGYRFIAPVEVDSRPLSTDDAPLTSPILHSSSAGDTPSDTVAPTDTLGPLRPPSPWTVAEHKVVTVLVCKIPQAIMGATRQEAETWHPVRQTFVSLIQEEVARYQGTLQHVLEDSVLILFGAPAAQEDHAQRAVHAALGLRQRLRAASVDLAWSRDVSDTVRMGLHTGPLVIGSLHGDVRLDYTAVGDTTSLATRVQHLAPPGRVTMSEATHALVAGYFETQELDVDPHTEEAAPLRVFEVLRARGRRTRWEMVAERGVTPHVGRVRELALLEELFQQVKAGHGQVVCIAGEAGIGKSRHVFEFRRRLAAAGDAVTWLEGQCLSFGQTMPFLPVMDQLRAYFEMTEADSPSEIREKVANGMRHLGTLEAHLPALHYLLAGETGDSIRGTLQPATRRKRLFDALLALALGSAQHQPLILVYEDLHWIDASTETLLHALVDAVAGVPLMLLCTYRVGYTPPFESRSFLTTLTLQRLSAADTVAMVRHLLGTPDVPVALMDLLLEKTAGVPLFVEEVVKTLRAMGALRRDTDNSRLVQECVAVGVPDTLQGIITARLDRLSAAGKHTVQLASVVGRQFPERLLACLAAVPGPLEEVLTELQAHEIIERRALVPESVYRFTHAILQEVAYNSLLRQQRQMLHTTVGEALEVLYAERRTEQAAELAHHYWQGEHWSKARDYSVLAGDRALAAYANAEAQAHYARAIQAAQRAPDTAPQAAARLHANHGKALMILAAYDAAAAAYDHARALMQRIGDQRGEIDILLDLSTVYTNTHAFGAGPAREAIEQALAMARLLPDPAGLADCLAHRVRVLTRGFGQLTEAMLDAEEALTLARDAGNPQRLAETLVALGRLLQWRGDFTRGMALLHEGATLAQQSHAGFLFGQAAFFLGNAYTATGMYVDAWQWYQQLRAYADKAGDRYWIARVPNTIGGLHLELFDLDAALQLTLEGDEVAQRFSPWSEVRGHALVKAGLAYLLQGEHSHAELCFGRATALLESDIWMRWRWHIPLLRGWGELALAQGEHEKAWTYATQSLALATQTDSRKHIARAQWLQGRVLAARGQLDQAVQTLAASVHLAEQLQTPREVWLGKAALGRALAALGRDQEAETVYGQALQIIDAIVATLWTPQMRRTFLSAAAVLEVYAALGYRPALVPP